MTDLVMALTLGALTGFQLLNVTPSGAPISQLPLALIPTAAVPLLLALHITSVSALRKSSANTAASHRPAHCRREIEEKRIQLEIDALKEAAAWPGADRRTPVMLASQLMAAELCQEGHPPADCTPGVGPVNGKETPMNTRSPYPDAEVPDISPPELVLDRADERGAAVPLMGPADHGSASPLMGPAAPATVTPLLGPADRGTMVSLMGPADPGTATPLMLPSR